MTQKKITKATGEFKNLLETKAKPAIQKVQPERTGKTTHNADKDEMQLMVWVPTDLMMKVKMKTVTEKKTMKEIVIEILQKHL